MHSRIKLVTETDFKELSGIVGNFDFKFIEPFVIIAQDIDLSAIVGESLLDAVLEGFDTTSLNAAETKLLEKYIVPAVIQWSLSRGLTNMLFKYDNSGIVKRNSENGSSADLNEVSFMADQSKILAESYASRLQDYLKANEGLFPEYAAELAGQIKPTDSPSFTGGLYLGIQDNCDND